MADPKHLEIARQGAEAISYWRSLNQRTRLDLSRADLSTVNLSGANLTDADFTNAKLDYTDFSNAILYNTIFDGANLGKAIFSPLQIPILGDLQQGKTTLARALEKQQSDASKRYLEFVDKATQAERLALLDAAPLVAIVVIGAVDGIMNYAHEAVQKAKQKKVNDLAVFCNKLDLVNDDEDLELINLEIETLLEDNSFDSTNIKKGSALRALDGDADHEGKIAELLREIELLISLS
ncbi:MAG: pentapeptide repeat-containing protein [Lewinellaceae bacterium]|nr:pentapeptide repeat-containing protein [Lewinellaceae bacterium]